MVGLVFLVFFVISFITNILGSINPNVTDSYRLSGFMTGLLPFAFFIAYGLLSIPSGIMVEKYREKTCLAIGWALALAASLLFSAHPTYPTFVCSLFLIGSSFALLQVVINPLLRVAGGEGNFAFYSTFAQLIFGVASFLSPFVYTYLVTNLDKGNPAHDTVIGLFARVTPAPLVSLSPDGKPTPVSMSWVAMYWLFGVSSLLMVLAIVASRFPKVERKTDEVIGAWATHLELFRNPVVIVFFFGIFAYVGTEQGISYWISEFLRTYHGLNPEVEGAAAVGWFWGLMTVGCLIGMGLLKLFDSKVVLRAFVLAALAVLTMSLFGGKGAAVYGFEALGFFLSVMFPVTFSLALNSIDKHHGTFSGILCAGIAGGAIVPLVIGLLKDLVGLRQGMFAIYGTLSYLLFISFWATPLISNRTIQH